MSRAVIQATWNDVPHLSEAAKKDLYDTVVRLHPHQADARTKGTPSLGAGVIYPFPEEQLKVVPFEIPPHFKRAFGLDADAGVGWTAIVWGAFDPTTQVLYITDVYKSSFREIGVHIQALETRGRWIPGVGDAKNYMVTDYDSKQIIEIYKAAKFDIEYPDKAVEAGIYNVYELLVPQRLKVFSTCTAWFAEQRLYRRNEKGQIVKKDDHLMDATRYLVRSGMARAKVKPPDNPKKKEEFFVVDQGQGGTGWMSALLLPLLSLASLWT